MPPVDVARTASSRTSWEDSASCSPARADPPHTPQETHSPTSVATCRTPRELASLSMPSSLSLVRQGSLRRPHVHIEGPLLIVISERIFLHVGSAFDVAISTLPAAYERGLH